MPLRIQMHAREAGGHETSDTESDRAPFSGARGRGHGRERGRGRGRCRGVAVGQANKLAPEVG